MPFYTSIITIVYFSTLVLGLLGNCWVICSVIRSRRPRNGSLSPSDRLRTYIGILAVVDLLVTLSLVIKIVYVVLPNATIDTSSCRVIFMIDHLVKLASITCLACISIERYITIRKPFNSKVRRRFIQLTPIVALFVLALVLSGIVILASNVQASNGMEMVQSGLNCNQNTAESNQTSSWSIIVSIARWIVGISFLLQLTTVSTNYGQIVRHVRRKFWQRKARVVAHHNSRNSNTSSCHKQPLVAEPRYMRDMTAAIVRIAFFHVICWLPYCLMQVLPYAVHLMSSYTPLSIHVSTSVRLVTAESVNDGLAWLAFAADWLTYVNSAGNWIWYAAMNRDLRSIIRATTERRKRSTMSQNSPGSNLHRSLRRQMTQSLRFFYPMNSSAPNSYDESVGSINVHGCANPKKNSKGNESCACSPNGSLRIPAVDENGQLSPPATCNRDTLKKHSCVSNGSAQEGLFGMRNGRAHTYCSPRPVHFNANPISSTIPTDNLISKNRAGSASNSNAGIAAAAAAKKLMAAFAISQKTLTPTITSLAPTKANYQQQLQQHAKLSNATILEIDALDDTVPTVVPKLIMNGSVESQQLL
uniref:G-protein coupled receptors family 1 profile domain-containing protein n=1 Tax=Ditylenchus dipsaci TaxID=166011 RepID=A0A915CXL0_9BILA